LRKSLRFCHYAGGVQPAPFDADQALPGEDPLTTYLEDAIHWIHVYEELLGFKRHVIGSADEVLEQASPEVAREGNADKDLLRAQAQRYEKRLEFWRSRARELSVG